MTTKMKLEDQVLLDHLLNGRSAKKLPTERLQQDDKIHNHLKDEYTEVSQNLRHYSNLRFAIFSVYFAVIAGISAITFSKGQFDETATQFAKVGGLLITLVFWSFEERTGQIFEHFGRVAHQLEGLLGYSQLSTRPSAKFPVFGAEIITRLFFVLLTVFWVYIVYSLISNF